MPKKTTFNTANPEQLIYKTEDLVIEVLGGIKLDGLDRMRATLKIAFDGLAIRHNLDLYNDTQLEKFIRKTSEKLEINTHVVSLTLLELTNELEKYRLDKKKESETDSRKRKKLTPKERQSATDFLEKGNLLSRTNELIGKSGVIGEEDNRLLMYIIFTSRLTSNPLHIISFGSSGSGKSHLQEKVAMLLPEEDVIEVTVLSENAFYYFERRALAHKLLLIEDLDGAESSLYPLREIQSKKRITKTIAKKDTRGITRSVQLTVEGPVSVSGCTTRERVYEDNSNRSFLIYLDESPEQDSKVMAYQRAVSAGRLNEKEQAEAANLLQNSQRLLQPIRVINPYAELLTLPVSVFKPRRTNNHYLQFIEAVTFYYQWQRQRKVNKETGEEYIETEIEDIENANHLLKEILLRKSDELSGACRDYLEQVKVHLKTEKKTTFTNREIRQALRINESNQKRYTIQLVKSYFIKKDAGDKAKGYEYQIVSSKEYEELKAKIANVLDENLTKILALSAVEMKQVHSGSVVVHSNK